MRIVYLSPVGCIGGAERVLLSVMASVRQTAPSAELHLVACTAGPLLRQAEELGVQSMVLPMPEGLASVGDSQHRGKGWLNKAYGLFRQSLTAGPGVWRYARRLGHVLRDLAPDLVHSNGIKTHLLVGMAGAAAPVVWHVHDFYGERPVVRQMLHWARRGVAGAFTISKAVDRDVRALLPRLPTRVLYNTINVNTFRPGPAEPELLDRLAGLPPAGSSTVRVGLVATYARWKGQDVFLQAAARHLQQQARPAVRFYVIGGPIYHTQGSQFSKADLQALAQSLGIESHVGFIDFQQDPASIYRALDVVVHASTRPEPFGLTIVEAMACGRPVVASQAGGAAELFVNDQDAVGVAPGDAAGLASAIGALLEDPQRRIRLGQNAQETVVERFNQNDLGPPLIDAYRTWAGKVRGRTAALP